MRELRIGDRVRTPLGDATIASGEWLNGDAVMRDVEVGSPPMVRGVRVECIEPLPPDIPRERVADLHAAVTKRAEQLAAHGGGTVGTWLHAELSEVAEALRLLLEGGDDAQG